MLDGRISTKEDFEKSKSHINEVWSCICDNMVGDIMFVTNLMLTINSRFLNVLIKDALAKNPDNAKYAVVRLVKKEFIKLFDEKLPPSFDED